MPTRKLAAVLSADIVGYSKLMGKDETGTLAALRELRKTTFEPLIIENNGHVVKRMGDGWLVEFVSIVDAVKCAIDVQELLMDHEIIKLRIGIHVGDIVHEDEDIFGDGVNIASRLQEKAKPGGVAVSAFAHNSLDALTRKNFESIGLTQLKNIDQKIEIFNWSNCVLATKKSPQRSERPLLIVLPFSENSGPTSNAFLAEGLTDAVITGLSRFSWFTTLPRYTTYQYTGKAVNVDQLQLDHSVNYILEAGMRTSGNRIRINVQLLDVDNRQPLWSDQIDDFIDDPFMLEDNVTHTILSELTTRLLGAEERRVFIGTDGSAWDLMMQGRRLLWRINEIDTERAQELFFQAINLDLHSGIGQSDLAWTYFFQRLFGWGQDYEQVTEKAIAAGKKAMIADDQDAYAFAAAATSRTLVSEGKYAAQLARRAIDLNCNLASGYVVLAMSLLQTGDSEQAIRQLDTAFELSPRDPMRSIMLGARGIHYLLLGRIDDMMTTAELLTHEFPDMPTGWRQLAAAYAGAGRLEDAKHIIYSQVLRLMPGHTATEAGRQLPFGNNESARQLWVDLLVKAGLPK